MGLARRRSGDPGLTPERKAVSHGAASEARLKALIDAVAERSARTRRVAWRNRGLGWAALAVVLLLVPASEAAAAIGFVKNIGTNASATPGTTIAVTVPADWVPQSA